ncbi:16S rRNA (cytidine(1402)-2'-O)-methyltransferase [Pseudoclavibacter chungangensis]|uniref:Ribosomal RNA small subunit methyltransferase I n=1 Tax=Pseudoclavibacter chungangensis TaxID=587635 RepID=A0A7J5BUF9_9MICO|nr:16S rRNA (cytidine(1402)-2'-O)-methyltransferase [Pseudoclavibacter chungangensis]KAB1657986.1 16S rRNA (cytidine(1402)-2'-O)-methyltransferase [Pseudoclavibacter chungangensis]NYJ65857.1 16S rRNA (cytidine1402-2'-O)-methyltransferase [Pseudoclavibacter chungangensis]
MIILAGTPIGNLGDASSRLVETLRGADVVACEDTRTTARLLGLLGIEERPRLVALHEHNEQDAAAELVELAREADVVVVSDAGMPAVSDPGYRIVALAAERGVDVTSVPGPTAVVTALAVSGLPTDRFAFDGFVPRKEGERRRFLERLASERRTVVLFESPHRLAATLVDMASVWAAQPERRVVVCRELTKLHEEVRRGTAADLAAWAQEGVRGEIVIVIDAAAPEVVDPSSALDRVLALVAAGTRLKDAAATVAAETGLAKRELYEAALDARRARSEPRAE